MFMYLGLPECVSQEALVSTVGLFRKFLFIPFKTRRVIIRFDPLPGNVGTHPETGDLGQQRSLGQLLDMVFESLRSPSGRVELGNALVAKPIDSLDDPCPLDLYTRRSVA
jgi:hypothetical protein